MTDIDINYCRSDQEVYWVRVSREVLKEELRFKHGLGNWVEKRQ